MGGTTPASRQAYVLSRIGEPISKSFCTFCPYANTADSREREEARFRAHPQAAVHALRLEHNALALNEASPLYGSTSLGVRLAEDPTTPISSAPSSAT